MPELRAQESVAPSSAPALPWYILCRRFLPWSGLRLGLGLPVPPELLVPEVSPPQWEQPVAKLYYGFLRQGREQPELGQEKAWPV